MFPNQITLLKLTILPGIIKVNDGPNVDNPNEYGLRTQFSETANCETTNSNLTAINTSLNKLNGQISCYAKEDNWKFNSEGIEFV